MSYSHRQFGQYVSNSPIQEVSCLQQDQHQDNLADIDIQDLLLPSPYFRNCFNEQNSHNQNNFANQANYFCPPYQSDISYQLNDSNRSRTFHESNCFYQSESSSQSIDFYLSSALDPFVNYNHPEIHPIYPSYHHTPLSFPQCFANGQLLYSSQIQTTENYNQNQNLETLNSAPVQKTNAEKCKKYRDNK